MRITLILLATAVQAVFAQDPQFTDISEIAGTNFGGSNNGIVVGDFNNDNYEDFFVPCRNEGNKLMRNNGDGTFTNVIEASGIEQEGLTMTAVWGDIDNDGDLDLFVANYYTDQLQFPNYLYLNDGNGVFQDISLSAGVGTFDQTRSAHMCDVDGDGLTDIYVCNLSEQNILWHNNGDNTFSDQVYEAGIGDTQVSMGAMFFDYDNDGDPDLYLTHDAHQANILYENDGTGVFIDKSVESNLNYSGQGMGVDHGDINNDGHLDVYVTNLGQNCLFLNNGDGSFTNIAESAGVDDVGMGWGCFFLDYDNDGWEDIYIINDSNFSPESNKLYRNNGDQTFTIVSDGTPLYSFNVGFGGAWMDCDNNGYQEIIVANSESDVGVEIFRNDGSQHNWVAFELIGSVCKDAYGARIQFETALGTMIDEKTGGSSYASQNSHRLHFGLGNSTEIQNISVKWPDGELQLIENLPINQIHTIIQGEDPLSIDQISLEEILVYPNPFQTEISLTGNGLFTTLELMTIDGTLIGRFKEVDHLIIPDLSNGTYILNIYRKNILVKSQKLVRH